MEISSLKQTVDDAYNENKHTLRRQSWQRYLKEFSGKWWNENELSAEDSKVFCNYIFSTIQTTAPLLTDNRPIWSILPRKYYYQRVSDIYNDALKFLWETTRMDEKLLDAVYDALICGTGLLKVYFDPDAEGGLGEVSVDVVDPFDFVISPGATDIWDCSWCGMRRLIPIVDLKRMFPDKANDLGDEDITTSIDARKDRYGSTDIVGDYALVYEIWMRDDETEKSVEKQYAGTDDAGTAMYKDVEIETSKYPNGRIVTFLDNYKLLNDMASPFKHGRPPYVAIYDYKMPHEFWGQGEPDQIENLNREFNVRLQQIVEHARKYTKRNVVVDESTGLTSEQVKDAMRKGDQVLFSKAGYAKDTVVPMDVPALPSITTQILSTLPQLIEEVSGVTDVTKGETSKKQRQTATEMSMLLESSYTRTRQRVRNVEYSIKRLCTIMVELMMQFYTEPRAFYVHNDEEVMYGNISNSAEFAKSLKPADTSGLMDDDISPEERRDEEDYKKLIEDIGDSDEVFFDFIVEIQTNSTLPLDRQSLTNMLLKLAQMKIVDAQAVLETLRIPGTKRILARLKEQQQAAKQPQQPGGNGGEGGDGGDAAQIQGMLAQLQGGGA